MYSTRAWQCLSARVMARYRGQYGNWYPGYGRDPHPAGDLTVDHVASLEVWEYAFIGTGTVVVVEPGDFYVNRSEVVT